MPDNVLLVSFLRNCGDGSIARLDCVDYPWEILIRQARKSNLLSRVSAFLDKFDKLDAIPQKYKQQFLNAYCVANANVRSVKWETQQIYNALHAAGIEFALLKGGAYVFTENSAYKGRLFTDIDILVKYCDLSAAEKILMLNGWLSSSIDNYNQKYYRQWMHEIPPLRHYQRKSTLDVHHAILPPTAALKPSTERLWAKAVQLDGFSGLYVLENMDMILHSATHLFHEGEFSQGLRDISDIDLLLREFILVDDSWENLLFRARELNLERPLFYALSITKSLLETPVPDEILNQAALVAKLGSLKRKIMNALYVKALLPDHETCKLRGSGSARFLLYLRSHWLKMPWYLLLPHLSRKAWMRLAGKELH
ncbi:nucleotidyltransferase domain-containing protein [Methylomonas methanica]|uniref:Uncharacterized protein n=1 Tax=Methylomonas methanica (strain DSM 25384 / MC09) TaxID=857087 RepID=F9ZY33_METMM|nr:nucleotidyltransferase family protein [Methylomonas methanica]AEF99763.1 hypothetical protein Metme_1340 [Methylomonas methanica MC09]